MKAIHIKVEEAGSGNPPYLRDDGGFGVRLWSHQGTALALETKKTGYIVFMSEKEFWTEVFRSVAEYEKVYL